MATIYCILSVRSESVLTVSFAELVAGGWRRGCLLNSQSRPQFPSPWKATLFLAPTPFPLVKMVIYYLQLNSEIDATLLCFYASITIF